MCLLAIILILVALFWNKVKTIFREGFAPVLGRIFEYAAFALLAFAGGHAVQWGLKEFFCTNTSFIWCFLISLAILIIWGKESK